ncbi:hypothetical protein LTR56_011181 [Elasticomyces elasticus]|nr:hypothetical protein LTR56_011181 [Elasticomyces elasticus]KAK3650453.1 hypothetical protein LTR22_012544 [Elasticomyces elasticus]KAK4921813.1 hypothetical protein LTR49_010751 [Elasticomyces elasticus]KAK5753421.1 hypothetical protein LTS12_016472 [Elasticomyces elasticus]
MPFTNLPSLVSRGKYKLQILLHFKQPDTAGFEPLHSKSFSETTESTHDISTTSTTSAAAEKPAASLQRSTILTPTKDDLLAPSTVSPQTRRHSDPTGLPPPKRFNTLTYKPGILFGRALRNETKAHKQTSTLLRESKAEVNRLATLAAGYSHHIRHLRDEQATVQAELDASKKQADDYIETIALREREKEWLGTRIEFYMSELRKKEEDCRSHARTIREGAHAQACLRHQVKELERSVENDRDVLRAVRGRTWVPGWCWKAKVAELVLRNQGLDKVASEREVMIEEQGVVIESLKLRLAAAEAEVEGWEAALF